MNDFFNDGPGWDLADWARIDGIRKRAESSKVYAKILKELENNARRRQEEQRAHQRLSDCPFCGNKLPKPNVSVCGACGKDLPFWANKRAFKTAEDAAAYAQEARRKQEEKESRIQWELALRALTDFHNHNPTGTAADASRFLRDQGLVISNETIEDQLSYFKRQANKQVSARQKRRLVFLIGLPMALSLYFLTYKLGQLFFFLYTVPMAMALTLKAAGLSLKTTLLTVGSIAIVCIASLALQSLNAGIILTMLGMVSATVVAWASQTISSLNRGR